MRQLASIQSLTEINKIFLLFKTDEEIENSLSVLKMSLPSSDLLFKKEILTRMAKRKKDTILPYLDFKNAFKAKSYATATMYDNFSLSMLDENISTLNVSTLESTYGISTYPIHLSMFDDSEELLKFMSSFTNQLINRYKGTDRVLFIKALIEKELYKQNSISTLLNLYLLLLYATKIKLSNISEIAFSWETQKTAFYVPLLNETSLKLKSLRTTVLDKDLFMYGNEPNTGLERITIGCILEGLIYYPTREKFFDKFQPLIPELTSILTFLS